MGVIGFISGRCVHCGVPLTSSGLSVVAGFIGVRHRHRRVHLGSLVSLGFALRVVGFIQCRYFH